MSFFDKMNEAIQSVNRAFKEGDKVFIKNQLKELKYVIKSVNYLSYDLVLDIPEEEVKHYRKVLSESFEMLEIGFEHREERLKKNPPYSMDEIIKAEEMISALYVYNIREEQLKTSAK